MNDKIFYVFCQKVSIDTLYILTRILENHKIRYSDHEHIYKPILNYFLDSLLLNKTNLLLMKLQTAVSY
jgi:hypothetical protein